MDLNNEIENGRIYPGNPLLFLMRGGIKIAWCCCDILKKNEKWGFYCHIICFGWLVIILVCVQWKFTLANGKILILRTKKMIVLLKLFIRFQGFKKGVILVICHTDDISVAAKTCWSSMARLKLQAFWQLQNKELR